MAKFDLSPSEMASLLAEADVNNDNEIDYAEFVPIAVELVQAFSQKEQTEWQKEKAEVHEEMLLHGMPKEVLEVCTLSFLMRTPHRFATSSASHHVLALGLDSKRTDPLCTIHLSGF